VIEDVMWELAIREAQSGDLRSAIYMLLPLAGEDLSERELAMLRALPQRSVARVTRPLLDELLAKAGDKVPPSVRAWLEGLPRARKGRPRQPSGLFGRLRKGNQLKDRQEAVRIYDRIRAYRRAHGKRLRGTKGEDVKNAVEQARELGDKVTEAMLWRALNNRGRLSR
jgi:hypothetical protein